MIEFVDHRSKLKHALRNPDVLILRIRLISRYGKPDDPQTWYPPQDETQAEEIARYWVYWNSCRLSMPEGYWQAATMYYIDSETWENIAQYLDVAQQTAEQYASNALTFVVAHIERLPHSGEPYQPD